jgi:predicted DNA-binding protein (MmcQ/YjbR family)
MVDSDTTHNIFGIKCKSNMVSTFFYSLNFNYYFDNQIFSLYTTKTISLNLYSNKTLNDIISITNISCIINYLLIDVKHGRHLNKDRWISVLRASLIDDVYLRR